MKSVPRSIVLSLIALVGVTSISAQVAERPAAHRPPAHGAYFPSRNHWETRAPTEVGMDAALLTQAIEYAKNTIFIDPEHDLVVVWRWHAGGDFFARVVASIKS